MSPVAKRLWAGAVALVALLVAAAWFRAQVPDEPAHVPLRPRRTSPAPQERGLLHVRTLGGDGQPQAGVEVQLLRETDGDGDATIEGIELSNADGAVAFGGLEVPARYSVRAAPPHVGQTPAFPVEAGTQVVVLLSARLCPGTVRVVDAAARPFAGRIQAGASNEGGGGGLWVDLDATGRAWVARRRCGRFAVTVAEPKGTPTRRYWTLRGVADGEEEITLVPSGPGRTVVGAAPEVATHAVAVTLACSDCPGVVLCADTPCTGAPPDLTCTCPQEDAPLVGLTRDALYDTWGAREVLAEVPADTDALTVDARGATGAVSGAWTGWLPCTATARRGHAVGREVPCDPAGRFTLEGLRPGAWRVEVYYGTERARDQEVGLDLVLGDGEALDVGQIGPSLATVDVVSPRSGSR